MLTELRPLSDKPTDNQLSIYHKNKGEDFVKALLKPLKNRNVLWITLLFLFLLSVWYYLN
ncbi:hypothetical protein [Emticicia sp. BO119]|uniref:hypothetical protein n=1 Tax=Emticicia sp. BO119 TaxID=2757768 RepID=UPI0015F0A702|nr:hypothetical protein [Emticicia sp. BO119]MBA4852017.1 hypothetical protein [Emticicia sp. BO119]